MKKNKEVRNRATHLDQTVALSPLVDGKNCAVHVPFISVYVGGLTEEKLKVIQFPHLLPAKKESCFHQPPCHAS